MSTGLHTRISITRAGLVYSKGYNIQKVIFDTPIKKHISFASLLFIALPFSQSVLDGLYKERLAGNNI
jgi:hypothetical protein